MYIFFMDFFFSFNQCRAEFKRQLNATETVTFVLRSQYVFASGRRVGWHLSNIKIFDLY